MALSRKLTSKIYEIKAHSGKVTCLDLGETGRVLVTGGQDRNVNLWAIGESECFMSLPGHNGVIDCVKFAYNDDFVYSADDIGIIRRWDLNAQTICSTLNGHMKSVRTLDFNPSGEYVVSGSNDTTVRLWDVRNQNRCIKTYRGHIANVSSVKFSPDGLWIASSGTEGSVIIWDIRKSRQIIEFGEKASPVTCIQFHPNEFLLAAGRSDGSVYIYDLEKNQLISKTEHKSPYGGQSVKCITFSENGECLFVGSSDGISVIGWEPTREFDRIEPTWNILADIKIVNREVICGSYERDTVSVHTVPIDRISPFYVAPIIKQLPNNQQITQPVSIQSVIGSTSPFSYNQSTRKSFSRGTHKLNLSIDSNSKLNTLNNNNIKKSSRLVEENEDSPNPSLDGISSSPNLSIEIIDIDDQPIRSSNIESKIEVIPRHINQFPSVSPVTSESPSSCFDLNSFKATGERDINKFEKYNNFDSYCSSFDNDIGSFVNDSFNDSNPPIILSYETAETEDFPVNNAKMPDYAPRSDNYHSNLQSSNKLSTSNKSISKSKSTVSLNAQRKNSQPGIPVKILDRYSGGTFFGGGPNRVSYMQSVSSMDLHKMDDNMSMTKRSTTQMSMSARGTRRDTSANSENNFAHRQNTNGKDVKHSKEFTVQIFNKKPPPVRSKTSIDLRGRSTTATVTPTPKSINYTPDDSMNMQMLSAYHNQVYQELNNRHATLQLIRNSTRSQDVVGALKQAMRTGRTIFVDLLGAILEKSSTWNLDLCLLLLPEIYELLQSQQKFHYTRACDTLRVILKNFLPIIQENCDPWSLSNSLGVDVTREERQRKCLECQDWLLRIRTLPTDTDIASTSLAQLQNLITF